MVHVLAHAWTDWHQIWHLAEGVANAVTKDTETE